VDKEQRAFMRQKTQDPRLKTQNLRIKTRGLRFLSCVLCLASCVLYAGCAVLEQPRSTLSATEANMMRGTEGRLPQSFQLHDVPHNPRTQRGTDCAPDSLRMVLNYRGKDVSRDWDIPLKLSKDVTGLRGRNYGTSFYQMQQIAVKFYDLPAFVIHNCDLYSLKAAILNGWPPVISYRASGRSHHAVVAVGYDDERRVMLVHDPNYIRTKKMRYYDLGGASEGLIQRLSCLLVLPEGSTEEELRRGLEKYVPKKLVSELGIYPLLPPRNSDGQGMFER